MGIQDSKYTKELETGLEAAEKAGEIIDGYARDGFEDWDKEDGSKVTEADIESQKTIVETISEEFPEDGFLGEEEELEPEGEDRVWVIDPVDGTFNFEKGFGFHCVSIALEVEEETVVGVVHLPGSSLGKTYFAVKDSGAFKRDAQEGMEDAEVIEVSEQSSIDDSIYFMTAFDIYQGELEWEKEALGKLAGKGGVHRQLGAAAVELCHVAEGKADLLVNPILKPWDYSAGGLIIEEAGGEIEIRESPFPDSEIVIASNGRIQQELESLVEKIEI